MPRYEYTCDICRVLYEVQHGMTDPPMHTCRRCGGSVTRKFSAPNLNTRNHSSPTAARYARLTPGDEMAREKMLQRTYETIWLPPPVKHNPWEEHEAGG